VAGNRDSIRYECGDREVNMKHRQGLIYIVDDDESVRKALKRLLRSQGFRVETFTSAEDFLNSDYHGKSACLILDVRMPGLSGFDLREHLAASGSELPIIFITAYDDVHMRERAEKSKVIAYLHKPLDDEALLDAIRRAFEQT
jgi:FixJ family two-component response regulator